MWTKTLSAGQLFDLIKQNPGATSPELRRKLGKSGVNVKSRSLTYHCFALMKKGLITREKDQRKPPFTSLYRYYPAGKHS